MIEYYVGDEYPNLQGKVQWKGSVKTDTMTAILLANGLSSGVFTGAVTIESSVSENDIQSNIEYSYDVDSTDTAAVGTFNMCIQVTHDNGDQETIDLDQRVEVIACA